MQLQNTHTHKPFFLVSLSLEATPLLWRFDQMDCAMVRLNGSALILQLLQNTAPWLLLDVTMYVIPILQVIHWLPLSSWARCKVLLIIYKALNDLGPTYLQEYRSCYALPQQLHSSEQSFLKAPPCKWGKISNYLLMRILCDDSHLMEWPT